ncbi:CHAT domain-containing protein [Microtetraspora sp. NBRC 13810]|uniref:CHAT domain-containing protein n=1 Tax=Microtetraspora sp. NBRC 13810 TaxID=3030990 RepID=UPI0025560244|nr:CHAT domain-containing protein [Microtetraspora sp. NBRC 13810]
MDLGGDDNSRAAFTVRLGRALIREAEGGVRRNIGLAELAEECAGAPGEAARSGERDGEGDGGRAYAVGAAALAAREVCADPRSLDGLGDDERGAILFRFTSYLAYLSANDAEHLAPRPVTIYPEVVTRFSDGAKMALAWKVAAAVILETAGLEAYTAAKAVVEEYVAGLPAEVAAVFRETDDLITTGPALAVGRALRDEAERGLRRYPSLVDLIQDSLAELASPEPDTAPEPGTGPEPGTSPEPDTEPAPGTGPEADAAPRPGDGDAAGDEDGAFLVRLGGAAMQAAGICARPGDLDQLPEDARSDSLYGFLGFLQFVLEHRLWHLAPQPFTAYREIIPRFDDPEPMTYACICAAAVVRERGELAESLAVLLLAEEHLGALPAEHAATVHLHAANTLRDLRRFDEAERRYASAEEAAARLGAEERGPLLVEIGHQRHRLSTYARPAEDLPGAGTGFDPNPFLPGSIFNDPGRWREQPWQLLTLAQNAVRGEDHFTAHRALAELADAAAPSDYDLLAALHHEVAELAHRVGASARVVRWHGFLCVCATILSDNHRELGIRLSRQAVRLAAHDDHLSAYNLALWAQAADRVPLYTAGILADIAFVLYRNGTLDAARNRFEASLAAVPDDDLVRAQRDMVALLVGEEPIGAEEPARRPSRSAATGAARLRAAARLLTAPADDLDAWQDLLLYSKGSLQPWSPALHTLVESVQRLPEGGGPGIFGNTPVDGVKARVFQILFTSGLLGLLDRHWSIPPWAGAAWALSGDPSQATAREEVGLEIAVSAPAAERPSAVVSDPADAPNVTDAQRREIAAWVDRLLALTFLPERASRAFGGAAAAAGARSRAAAFVAAHGNRLAFRLRDQATDRYEAENAEALHRFLDALSRLPPRLRDAVGAIESLRQAAVEAGPVRDFRAIENTCLAGMPEDDARPLRELFASRVGARQILPSHAKRLGDEVRSWFTGPGQATVDLVQGTGTAHSIACRTGAGVTGAGVTGVEVGVTVGEVGVSRAAAQAAVRRVLLPAPAPDEVGRLVGGLRAAAGGAREIALRPRQPWEQIPVENIPDGSGRSLAQDHVVVRRYGRRPRFGVATARFPDRAEVLGDPMGTTDAEGLPGALDEAYGVAEAFGVTAVVRDGVTWDRLRYSARVADLLWISTHCEPVRDLGGAAALRLRDRWVLPAELAALDVNPGLVVVLTVCAGGRGVPLGNVSEPPTATAFLTAGADLVISPIRPINDVTWGPLIVTALRRTLAGEATPAELVRLLNASTPAAEPFAPWVMHA